MRKARYNVGVTAIAKEEITTGFYGQEIDKILHERGPRRMTKIMIDDDVMKLPPVKCQKVLKAAVWKLFYPLLLAQPQTRRLSSIF
jgi:hypothetical protein